MGDDQRRDLATFWHWLFKGDRDRPGYHRIVNRWALLHMAVGLAVAYLSGSLVKDAATSLLLPLAGIFIGLSFAWGGNAQALLQTEEIEHFADYHPGGFSEYLYTFQLAILVILVTLCLWGLAGLGIFDRLWPTSGRPAAYLAVEAGLFALASLTVRSCWHVVLGAQYLLAVRHKMRQTE